MAVLSRARIDPVALRHTLERRRWRLAEDLRLRVARVRDRGGDAPQSENPDDDSTDLDVMLVDVATRTLQVIDTAIDRLDRGQYGRCARCRGRISEARLRAIPFAVRCRECQRVREREAALDQPNLRRRPWNRAEESAAGHDNL